MNGLMLCFLQVRWFHSHSLCLSNQDDAEETKVSAGEGVQGALRAHVSVTVPERSSSTRSLASVAPEDEEPTVSSKELGEWLRQHPSYTMDMAAFTPVRVHFSYQSFVQSYVEVVIV